MTGSRQVTFVPLFERGDFVHGYLVVLDDVGSVIPAPDVWRGTISNVYRFKDRPNDSRFFDRDVKAITFWGPTLEAVKAIARAKVLTNGKARQRQPGRVALPIDLKGLE